MFKKQIFFLVLMLSYSMQAVNNNSEDENASYEAACNTFILGTFYTTLALVSALLFSRSFQSFVFGARAVDTATGRYVEKIASSLEVKNVPSTRQAYSQWHSIAGTVFSNHDLLFINADALQKNHNDELFIREIKKGLINIKHNRDRPVLIASAIIPLLVFGGAQAASTFFKKASLPNYEIIRTLKKRINDFSQNFTAKTLVSLIALYSFIKIQDYWLHSNC